MKANMKSNTKPDVNVNLIGQRMVSSVRYLESKESNGTSSYCVDDSMTWEAINHTMVAVVSVTLILVGTVGNIVTYCVFSQKVYKNNVMASVLRYMMLVDSIFLWSIGFFFVLKAFNIRYDQSPTTYCFFLMYLGESLSSLADWLLVAITFTRLIGLKWPFYNQTICTKVNFYSAVALIHLCIFGINALVQYSVLSRMSPAILNSDTSCLEKLLVKGVVTPVDWLIHLVIVFAGPAVFLIVLNAMIVKELWSVEERRNKLTAASSSRLNVESGSSVDRARSPTNQTVSTESGRSLGSTALKLGSAVDKKCAASNTLTANLISLRGTVSNGLLKTIGPLTNFGRASRRANRRSSRRNSRRSSVPSAGRGKPVIWSSLAFSQRANDKESTGTPSWLNRLSKSLSQPVDTTAHVEFPSQSEVAESLGPPKSGHGDSEVDGAAHSSSEKSVVNRDNRVKTLTTLLIISSALFVFLNTPYWVFALFFFDSFFLDPSLGCFYKYTVLDGFLLMRFSTHSLDFLFYCVVGGRFRKEFSDWLRGLYCRVKSSVSVIIKN